MADDQNNANGASDLEHKVNDKNSKSFMRKAFDMTFNLAMAAGTTALGYLTVGPAAPIVSAAFGGGGLIGALWKKKETGRPLDDILNSALKTYSAVNTVFYPMTLLGNATYPAAASAGSALLGSQYGSFIGRSAWALTGFNMAFVAAFKAAYHLYENKLNPQGIGKSIADNFVPFATRIGTVFAPGYILAANGIPDLSLGGYKVPTFAVNAIPTGIYNELNPPGQKKKTQSIPSYSSQTTQSQLTPQQIQNMQNYYARNQGAAGQLAGVPA